MPMQESWLPEEIKTNTGEEVTADELALFEDKGKAAAVQVSRLLSWHSHSSSV